MDLLLRERSHRPSKPPSSYRLSQSCAHLSDCMRSVAVSPMPFLRTQTIYTTRIRARILESFSLRHAFLGSSLFVSHNTSEIDGSGNLSARGLNLEQIFACSCIYSARSCRHLSSYPAVSNWLITNQIPGTGNCGSFYFSYFFQIVLYALYNLINVPFDCISFLFYVRCFLFDLLCQVKSGTNILPKLKKFF